MGQKRALQIGKDDLARPYGRTECHLMLSLDDIFPEGAIYMPNTPAIPSEGRLDQLNEVPHA
jgi:hypothetical protein